MNRAEAIELVRRIMDGDYASDEDLGVRMNGLDRALACPSGHVSDLIFWPPERDLSPDEVVDQALAYRPTAL